MPVSPAHKEILSPQSESKTLLTNGKIENGKRYHINQDYFKTWSHNMAYVLGLWFADGCIYKDKMFDITLPAKDKYILQRVKEELGYKGNLYDCVDRQVVRINFSCKVIYDDLISISPFVLKEFLPDFVRGYFDGNGSIKRMKNNRLNSSFYGENEFFLLTLLEVLKAEAGIVGGSFDDSSMTLRFGKNDTLRLCEYMYKNNPELFLLRKYEKYLSYKEDNLI